MSKITTEELDRAGQQPRRETALEKTARTAREIMEDEAETRREKTEKLRKARLQHKGRAPTPAEVEEAQTPEQALQEQD
ncbi:hypothetical protein MHM88_04890 [Epibacterium sp. MM17-32]|uniref:hypothetical protein n=1 Tax=Epibacterium sp. MM17-32 TaxID=2917734 RepID=UPI001EF47694|nr:hypothetical protein [Epibacterium sp. MM17-32]MCG7627131.1 hypothetical protein [Epibacterium sp. MM17-32]